MQAFFSKYQIDILAEKFLEFRWKLGKDYERAARLFYTENIDFFADLREIMLLRTKDSDLTDFYFKRAALMGGSQIINYNQLKLFLNEVYDLMGESGCDSMLYIALHGTMKKFFTFRKPKAHPILFIIKNVMLRFRDQLRTIYQHLKRWSNISFTDQMDSIESIDLYDFDAEKDFFTRSMFLGDVVLPSWMDNRQRYIAKLLVDRMINIGDIALTARIQKANLFRTIDLIKDFYRSKNEQHL